VAYSGKLAWFKGVDVLLEAATQYESRLPRVATVIAGDGDQRSALETQAARLGLKRVHFLGDRRQRDCAILYALADVVAMPSRGEPFGLVALEAMASGTPLVATASGGLNEIVNDAVGGLVPLDDSHALAAAIDRAVVENWKQVKGPAAARYVAEKHDAKTWISRIEAVYRDALRDRFGIAR
jgi:1,4-alpha-glucan branching enzyme